MNSTIVNLSDSSPVAELARLLSTITGDDTPSTMYTSGRIVEVYNYLIDNSDKIFALTHTEVDTTFSLAIAGLVEATTDVPAIIKNLANTLSSDAVAHVTTKLNILKFMFNFLEAESALRYEIFIALLKLVLEAKIPEIIVGQFASLDKWVVHWKLNEVQLSNLYYQASLAYEMLNDQVHAQEYLYKSLQVSEAGDSTARALKAAINSLTLASPQVCLSEHAAYDVMLSLPSVMALAKGEDACAVKFLEIFSGGSLAHFDTLAAEPSAKAFLERHNIDQDAMRTNMIALCIAGSVSAGTVRSYADLMTVTGAKTDAEVEEYVVDAIFVGQIDAKLNQKEKTVRFDVVKPRLFNADSWKSLKERILNWKESALHTYQESQIIAQTNTTI